MSDHTRYAMGLLDVLELKAGVPIRARPTTCKSVSMYGFGDGVASIPDSGYDAVWAPRIDQPCKGCGACDYDLAGRCTYCKRWP